MDFNLFGSYGTSRICKLIFFFKNVEPLVGIKQEVLIQHKVQHVLPYKFNYSDTQKLYLANSIKSLRTVSFILCTVRKYLMKLMSFHP